MATWRCGHRPPPPAPTSSPHALAVPPQANNLRPDEVFFLDVGANLGIFTLSVAAHGFSVIGFEPMYSNWMAIRLSTCATASSFIPRMDQRITLVNKVGLGLLCPHRTAQVARWLRLPKKPPGCNSVSCLCWWGNKVSFTHAPVQASCCSAHTLPSGRPFYCVFPTTCRAWARRSRRARCTPSVIMWGTALCAAAKITRLRSRKYAAPEPAMRRRAWCQFCCAGCDVLLTAAPCCTHAAVLCRGIKVADLVVSRLDDELRHLFPTLKNRIGAMKIDVEGHEALVRRPDA